VTRPDPVAKGDPFPEPPEPDSIPLISTLMMIGAAAGGLAALAYGIAEAVTSHDSVWLILSGLGIVMLAATATVMVVAGVVAQLRDTAKVVDELAGIVVDLTQRLHTLEQEITK